MSRNGSGVYSKPAGTTFTPNTVIESAKVNTVIDDIAADLNLARPVVAGGTGATSAATARTNLGVDPSRTFVTKSANYTALAADKAANIRFDGAYTLSLTAAATLGSGWYCYVQADGGAVTIDPNASETINGAATYVVYDGGTVLVACDGTNFQVAFQTNPPTRQVLTTGSGTYNRPSGVRLIRIRAVAGGGGGGYAASASAQLMAGAGGQSGAYAEFEISNPSATYAYAIGPGGNGGIGSSTTAATNGGNTTFGVFTLPGGVAGGQTNSGTGTFVEPGGYAFNVPSGGTFDFSSSGEQGALATRHSATVGHAGRGASSPFGAGGQASGGTNPVGAGGNGRAPGAGGAGAINTNGLTSNGGSGHAGIIIIDEYY